MSGAMHFDDGGAVSIWEISASSVSFVVNLKVLYKK